MKRVFILLLVLAMASMAHAKAQILVDGDKNIGFKASTHFSLGIWTDTAIPSLYDSQFALVTYTLHATTTIDYTSGITVPPYDSDPGITLEHSMGAAEVYPELPAGTDGIFGSITLFNPSTIEAGAIIFDNIDLYTSWLLDVPIYLYQTQGGALTIVDTVIVWGIPEPMTIGLLGLGALFLRKRKA